MNEHEERIIHLVGEDDRCREENQKQFRREDGMRARIVYDHPVHYKKGGAWERIDNTLYIEKGKDGKEVYRNTASSLEAELAVELSAEKVGTLTHKGKTLSWQIEGLEKDSKGEVLPVKEEKDHDQALIHPKELFSSVQYEKALHGADLVYELDSVLLRERIVLHNAEDGLEKYVYTLHWDGEIRKTEEGLLFCEGEETILRLHAPELIDSKGEWSETKTELKKTGAGEYAYTVTVPLEWLRAEERSYPVVLDPSVGVPFKDYIVDYHISSSGAVQDRDSLMVGSSNAYRAVIKADISSIVFPTDCCFLQEADLVLSRYVYSGTNDGDITNVAVQLYQLTKPWPGGTWPANEAGIADLYDEIDTTYADSQAKAGSVNQKSSWDITDIGKKWLAGEDTDRGLLLKSYNDSKYVYFRSSGFSATYDSHPYFAFIFADANGMDSRWMYFTQNTSRCGSGSINAYSGSLHVERGDGQITNGCMPVSVGFSYNSADRAEDIGYGKGFTMSYAQRLQEVHYSDPVYNETTKYLRLTDGQGTDRYYKFKSNNKWEYELDHETKIVVSGNTGTLEDKKGNKMIFALATDNDQLLYGRLTAIQDANGNEIEITYRNSSDLRNMRVSLVKEKLFGQEESDRQGIQFMYDSDTAPLNELTVLNGLDVSYTYTNGHLTAVEYADHLIASYTYDNDGRLTCMEDPDSYRVLYTWGQDAEAERVVSVVEKTGTGQEEQTGHSLSFSYARNKTKVEDERERKTVYQFDNYGQVCSVRDTAGNAVFSAYNTAAQSVTELSAVSKMQKTVTNLLLNHGFETGDTASWTVSSSADVTASTAKAHTGKYSLEIKNLGHATQTVTVDGGQEGENIKTFTLSAYFTGAAGGKLRVQSSAGTYDSEASAGSTEWERLQTSFQVPHGPSTVTVSLLAPSSGTVYCDGVQLECSDSPSRYNMVNNGAFQSTSAGFTVRSEYCTADDAVVTIDPTEDETHPKELGNQVFHMVGAAQFEKTVDQIIEVTGGQEGDTYSFGGWLKSNGTPPKGQHDTTPSYYYNGIKQLEVTLFAYNAERGTGVATFGADTTEWQYGCAAVAATGSYNKIRVRMRFSCISNDAWFDGIQLYKETFSTAYTYSSNGNLTGRTTLIGQDSSYTYNNQNDMTQSKDPRGNRTTYTYDDKHNMTRVKSPEDMVRAYTRNDRGQETETKVYEHDHSGTYIRTTKTYAAAHALTTAVTDARGKSVLYEYARSAEDKTRLLAKITDPKGNKTTYNYGDAESMLRLASLTSDDTGTVSYGYEQYGKLTTITRGTTVYGMTYDGWNRPVSTKVGSTALSTNEYDTETRLLDRVTYANGFAVRYEYDKLDRVTKIHEKQGAATEVLAYEFLYNNEGDLYALRNWKTNRVSFFEYDHAGRCMASKEYEFTAAGNGITLGNQLSGYRYEYDANNNLTKLVCNAAGGSWNTVYTYDKDNRPKTTTFSSGKVLTNTYDGMGRVTRKRLGLNSNYDTNLTYVPGANGSQTALLSTYTNGSDDAYEYAYDDNGNITQITQGSASVTYEYNGANELVRENNGFTDETVTYTYDLWGNLRSKKTYAYTEGDLSNLSYTEIVYGYTTTGDWKDQLVSYGAETIVYDAMGNPTSYRGKSLTWRGKQLTGVSDTAHNLSATYTYDTNGLRQQKTVNNVDTDYYYNGSVLIGLTRGDKTLRFSYDAAGLVSMVEYEKPNETTQYYYLRNGQGDIVKLIDSSGAAKVEYTYDSWGKPLSCIGTLATSLGVLNPFRYRGYVYDEETGFYYLKSRYYDPETCRFISADVYLSTGQGVLGHNCYAYCMNAPVSGYDPDGKSMTAILVGIAVAGIIGGCFSVASGGNFITGFYSGAFAAGTVFLGVSLAGAFCTTVLGFAAFTALSGAFAEYCGYWIDITGNQKEYDSGTAGMRTALGLFSGLFSGALSKLSVTYSSDATGVLAEIAAQYCLGVEQEGFMGGIKFVFEYILNTLRDNNGNKQTNHIDLLSDIDIDSIFDNILSTE